MIHWIPVAIFIVIWFFITPWFWEIWYVYEIKRLKEHILKKEKEIEEWKSLSHANKQSAWMWRDKHDLLVKRHGIAKV